MKITIILLLSIVSSVFGQGIASRYYNDIGIQNDPQVVLFDGFERYSYPSQMLIRNGGLWDGINGTTGWNIDTSVKFSGNKSAQVQFPIIDQEWSRSLRKHVTPAPKLFAGHTCDMTLTIVCEEGTVVFRCRGCSAAPHADGTPPDGSGWFVFLAQNYVHSTPPEPQPGYGEIYAYWPHQRDLCGDHWQPTGVGFPWHTNPEDYPDFVPRPVFNVPLGQWFCYELMVKVNDIGMRNGEVKVWKNGVLVEDYPDLFIRSVPNLLIDDLIFTMHAHRNANPSARLWWDNVVIASDYIGPINR